jgi:hypothetical protein
VQIHVCNLQCTIRHYLSLLAVKDTKKSWTMMLKSNVDRLSIVDLS